MISLRRGGYGASSHQTQTSCRDLVAASTPFLIDEEGVDSGAKPRNDDKENMKASGLAELGVLV
jgi:hypothetical protein